MRKVNFKCIDEAKEEKPLDVNSKIAYLTIAVSFAAFLMSMYYPLNEHALAKDRYDVATNIDNLSDRVGAESKGRMLDQARAWNQQISGNNAIVDESQLWSYGEQLGFDKDGCIGYVISEDINLIMPIYKDGSKNVGNGSIHIKGTSLPVGGENTNSSILVRQNSRGVKIFDDLSKLSVNSVIGVRVLGDTRFYKVYENEIVDNGSYLDKTSIVNLRDVFTIIRSSGDSSKKIVIQAERCDIPEGYSGAVPNPINVFFSKRYIPAVFGLSSFITLVVASLACHRKQVG